MHRKWGNKEPLAFPGIFFILPCIDAYARVDLRTRTYDVPPQEVSGAAPFTNSYTVYSESVFIRKGVANRKWLLI